MTTIDDIVYYADGSKANGQVLVSWPLFQYNGTAVVAGQETFPIVDGQLLITLYSNITALPTGTYYTANFELEEGAREEEYWIVPNLPVVTLSQCRATFPPAPGLLINALQLSGGGAQPGQFLGWNGSQWVPMYVTTLNVSPNTIGLNVTAVANPDISVSGTPATLGTSLTLNIPDAGSASRGAVTAGAQSIGGVKTFLSQVNFTTVAQYSVYAGTSSVWGATYFGTANKFHLWGSVILSTPDSSLATIQADGALLKHVDLSGGAVGTVALPGGAVTIPGMESILLPTGPNYTHGLGVDGAGNLWLGTASPTASFAYLRPDQAWVANWVDLSPYQHPSLPNTEVTPNAASIVLYKDATQWAGIGYDQNMRMWFRLGPNASGTYYYLGANQVSFANANYYVNSVLIGHRAGVNLIASSNVTLSGGDNPSNNRVDVVIAASGSLVDPTTTLGDFIVRGSAALNRLGVGSDGEVLTVDSSQTLGVRWAVAGAATGGVPSTRQVIAGPGLYGGGELIADVTLGALVQSVFGRTGNIVLTGPDITAAGGVLQTRKILTGIGLSGGGDLSADRTLIGVAMGASGASHAMGMVPDPGATAGVTHYLREDATWVVPPLGLADPTTSVGDLIVRGSPVIARLPVGSNGQVLTADSAQTLGVKWATVAAGFVSPLTTKGDIMVYDTATTRLPVGTNGQVLTADSTQTPGLRWGAASSSFWVGGTGGVIYYNGGNVGIGTTSPSSLLSVTGVASGAVLPIQTLINNASVTVGQSVRLRFGAHAGFIGSESLCPYIESVNESTSSIAFAFGTYTSAGLLERMRITGVGNVGIGTTTPQGPLSLANQLSGDTVFRPWPNMDQGVFAFYQVQNFPGANSYQRMLDIVAGGSTVGGNIRFVTQAGSAAGVTAMFISAAGNVGIGIATPGALLEIHGVDVAGPDIITGLLLSRLYTSVGDTMTIDFGGSAARIASVAWGGGEGCITFSAQTGGNNGLTHEVMRVQGNGFVGIGTTVPSRLLQIVSAAGIATQFNLTQSATATWDIQLPASSPHLTFGQGGTEFVRFTNAGSVGINTATPGGVLEVAGGNQWVVFSVNINNNLPPNRYGLFLGWNYSGGGTEANIAWHGAFLAFADTSSNTYVERMRISSLGNVGIGTTSPGVKLDVISNDNTDTGNCLRLIAQNLSQNATYSFAGITSTFRYSIQTGSGYALTLQASGGSVGIGRTPTYTLDVVGNVNCTGSFLVNGAAIGSGSGQPQTPWAQDIQANGKNLTGGATFTINTLTANVAVGVISTGNITIGTTSVSAGGLAIQSDYALKGSTSTWQVASDVRTKQNMRPLEGGLDVIRRLPPPIVAEYNGLANTLKDVRVVSFDLEKLREILPHTVGSHRAKLREEDAEETDILHYNIHEVVMHLILAVKQLAEKN